jgi:hypothetical protein
MLNALRRMHIAPAEWKPWNPLVKRSKIDGESFVKPMPLFRRPKDTRNHA